MKPKARHVFSLEELAALFPADRYKHLVICLPEGYSEADRPLSGQARTTRVQADGLRLRPLYVVLAVHAGDLVDE